MPFCVGAAWYDSARRGKIRQRYESGSIELICGSMFSGKTEELIRRARRARIAKQKVQVFKPALDDRYQVEKLASHDGLSFDAVCVGEATEILDIVDPDTDV
ncbi:MAG TPA: hypothetical protein VJ714_08740, partial [Anaerolineae bacterium]|nr:hypothetical protein [Anaerolineae bacterium]